MWALGITEASSATDRFLYAFFIKEGVIFYGNLSKRKIQC